MGYTSLIHLLGETPSLTLSIGASTWSVGSSMVAGGLVWYDAMISIIIGHLIGSLLTVWNGRGGSVYHIGVCDLFFNIGKQVIDRHFSSLFGFERRSVVGVVGSLLPFVACSIWCGLASRHTLVHCSLTLSCNVSWGKLPQSNPEHRCPAVPVP